ncbi:hypothetical protein GALMADRAFT_77244 [Galerina marginata CBS 339.88]|uniref:Uncharacterized protein n=1 Tax=Galerina marginata (strain CBS 339.88) TaxID=685588 RepID=A0A067SF88_GALM3|nr:hypothetical protein GALMADRAFT_77244 [Galerina marginata CBS 339.88]
MSNTIITPGNITPTGNRHSEFCHADGDLTPTATLTPQPSFSNFRFSAEFSAAAAAAATALNDLESPEPDLPFRERCEGQWVDWYPGSVWDTYAYQQHEHRAIPWTLNGTEGQRVRLRSKTCNRYLQGGLNSETVRAACTECIALLKDTKLKRFMERASKQPEPRTPWKYLNFAQIRQVLMNSTKKARRLELQVRATLLPVQRLSKKMDDYKRLVMMLSQKKIAGVATILAVCLRNGDSPQAIHNKLEQAINGTYAPRSGWTNREYDIAFLAKALSGTRLLYALQKAEGYPSNTTLKRRRPISEITVSIGRPSADEVNTNISAFLGKTGRKPPPVDNFLIGQTLMIDGIALEEACRYEHARGVILGVCREHAANGPRLLIESIEDIDNMAQALYESDGNVCHHGKDGTVVAIAPLTGTENYFPVPLVLSPSCKTESGNQLEKWLSDFLDWYRLSPYGECLHGKIERLATDGESSFRFMRFSLGLRVPLNLNTDLGKILRGLKGMNLWTAAHGLITTCDPKHVIKRFATMIRSPTGIQVGDTTLKSDDFLMALTIFGTTTEEKARLLLNPADKQNVPQAVNLLQTLLDTHDINTIANPSHLRRIRDAVFFANILGYFLFPFIKVEMSLSEQIRSLSTFAHLLTALHLRHRSAFMNNALFGDSQAIVKSIIFNVARLQTIRPDIQYHILFEGTDRLEGVFSHARTQDHARNFDVLQLAHKLSVGAEINAIFERNLDLDRGHARRNLVGARGVDHVNPKSWIGEVKVGTVDLPACYSAGRDTADKLLTGHFGLQDGLVNWETLFTNSECDHLRPFGEYVGSRAADTDLADDDSQELLEGLLHEATDFLDPLPGDSERVAGEDTSSTGARPARLQVNELDFEPQILNPTSKTRRDTPYLTVGTRERHIDALMAERLVSDRARKSTMRTLRAQGVTIAETITRRGQKLQSPENANDMNMVKAGDLGAFLVRVGDNVGLAVGEILNFRQGTSRNNLKEVNIDEIETEIGDKATTVALQVLDLSPTVITDGATPNFTWKWTKKYLQTLTSKDGVTSQRHFAVRIPGKNFYPLGPDVMIDDEDMPVWTVENSDLQAALNDAWESLNPDADEIVSNIESLPEIFGTSLPYKSSAGIPQLYVTNLPIQLTKLKAKDEIPCRICKKIVHLNEMRNHVGQHILRSLRTREFELPQIGLNPCGWCGLEGCKTQLIRTAKKTTISSNCAYHYRKMVYSRANTCSTASPCTNVPINCPICPKGRDQQAPTFWKYNLIHHMTEHHLDDQGELPPFPPELRVTTHITRLEEERMGVELADTIYYRTRNKLPDSDGLEDPMDVELQDVELSDSWDPSGYRKRAASVYSQTSSSSRQPSSPKVRRTE